MSMLQKIGRLFKSETPSAAAERGAGAVASAIQPEHFPLFFGSGGLADDGVAKRSAIDADVHNLEPTRYAGDALGRQGSATPADSFGGGDRHAAHLAEGMGGAMRGPQATQVPHNRPMPRTGGHHAAPRFRSQTAAALEHIPSPANPAATSHAPAMAKRLFGNALSRERR